MYNLQKNNYNKNPKNSNIQTPLEVSQFIYELLSPFFYQEYDYDHPKAFQKSSLILDPCCGKGNLLEPWKKGNYPVVGIDQDPNFTTD
jgi:hypothetical protein